jgi:murein DD-endopeptidase MepM/ murein hydrolase activator NlpD
MVLALVQTPAPGVEGTWRGTLATGAANLRLVLNVSKAPDGLLSGSLESLDQGSTIPIDAITVKGDTVQISLKVVGATFTGTLNAARTELAGTFTQGGALPLTFTRSTTATPPAPAAPPPPVTATTFPMGLPLDLRVPVRPTPFAGNDGLTYLSYELHITNMSGRDLLLSKIEAINTTATVLTLEGGDLNAALMATGPVTERRTIAPGRRAVAFIWLPIAEGQLPPSSLHHRITVGEATLDAAVVTVDTQKPVTIGPPLRGTDWMAVNGPSRDSGHRRALVTTEGSARIAQRFGIDWVQMHPSGATYVGDQKDNKSYRAYGAEVLAVASGSVVATKDGIPENVPGVTSRAVAISSETVGGNHIVLDLGGGRYAFYAHLQPGSLKVKVGDRVTRGQVIGLVGNSGNSTEPHLHFHISDGVSPLGSEGLPYVLDGTPGMPLQNARVTFGNK